MQKMAFELEDDYDVPMDGYDVEDMMPSQSQTQTQPFEFSDMEDSARCVVGSDDDGDCSRESEPQTPIDPLTVPWGRLIPYGQTDMTLAQKWYDLLPRHALEHVGSATRSRSISRRLDETFDLASPTVSIPRAKNGGADRQDANDPFLRFQSSPSPSPMKGVNFLGLKNIKSYDRFNEHVIGRSNKCDIVSSKLVDVHGSRNGRDEGAENPAKAKVLKTIHSMISNMHCRIFCMLRDVTNGTSVPTGADMQVYVEDSSGNGTYVNQTTLLKRNERRLLHTGDTICLLNPKIVQKKIKAGNGLLAEDDTRNGGSSKGNLAAQAHLLQKEILDHYTFVFINKFQSEQQNGDVSWDTTGPQSPSSKRLRTPLSKMIGMLTPPTTGGRSRGLVDARATRSNSTQRKISDSKRKHNNGGGGTIITNDQQTSPGLASALSIMLPFQRKRPRRDIANIRQVEQEYDLRDEIGSGTTGLVRRAIHRKTGEMVAVKVIGIKNTGGGLNRKFEVESNLNSSDSKSIKAEASILQSLDHPYIVKLVDTFIHPGKAVYLVMELMHGGDLFDRIVQKGRYSEVESRRVMRRMLAAVHYLHQERDIVHRDLKPENILCVSRSDDVTVKITDFGLAKSITEDGLKTFCGTPQYFAPEVLRRRNTVMGRGRYGKEADMWSLGVILYILLSGAPPFDASGGMDAVAGAAISLKGSRWKGISDEAKDLISKLLMKDPSQRISVVDSCSHDWIMTPDGDTHVHPLDDPVVIKVIGKNERIATTPTKSSSPVLPQSVLSSAASKSPSMTDQTPSKSNMSETKSDKHGDAVRFQTPNKKENKASKPTEEKEVLTPNQCANFPLSPPLSERRMAQSQAAKQRASLFSFLKQSPRASANDDLPDKKEDSETKGISVINDGEPFSAHQNGDNSSAVGNLDTERKPSAEDASEENEVESQTTNDKQKGRQTTLSKWLGKK